MKTEEYKISYEKGEDFLNRGDFNQAIKEFEIILEKWPNNPKSYNKLGVCYASLKNFGKAKLYLAKAFEMDAKYPEPYNNLGNIYLEEKAYGKAIELYKKALELNPDYAAAHSNLGLTYKKLKRIGEAVAHFKKASQIDRRAPLSEINKIKMKSKNKVNTIAFIILILIGLIILLFFLKR